MTTKPKSKKQLHIAGKGPFGSFVAKQKNREERFQGCFSFVLPKDALKRYGSLTVSPGPRACRGGVLEKKSWFFRAF
jgi:hypothetical protein